MKIWTRAYRPWILGGDVNAPVYTEVEPTSEHQDLGKGYQGVTVVSPSGKTFVVETSTGGIVGHSVEDVRNDVMAADDTVLKRQIENESLNAARAEPVTVDEFWRLLRAA